MDSKPLTARDIEDVQDDVKLINEFLELCSHRLDPWNMARVADAVAWLGVDRGKIVDWVYGYWDGEDVERKMMDMEKENARLLSLLTPPPDAALREAVANCEVSLATGGYYTRAEGVYHHVPADHLRTLLRAVQAPRLTKEQVEALWTAHDFLKPYGAHGVVRAAFPEAFAGEATNKSGFECLVGMTFTKSEDAENE